MIFSAGDNPPPGSGEAVTPEQGAAAGSPVPDSALRPPARKKFLVYLIVFLVSSGILAGLHGVKLAGFLDHDEYFFHDTPILTTADGYYFLRLTSEYLEGRYAPVDELRSGFPARPDPVPLLVSATAGLYRLTGLQLDDIAFYLPAILAVLSTIAFVVWGWAVGSPAMALIAALAGGTSVVFFFRSTLGRFDTDALNVFFVLAVSFFAYRFAVGRGFMRLVNLVLAAVSTWLFYLWWPQAAKFCVLPVATAYAASVFLPTSRLEKWLKIGLIFLGVLAAVIVVLDLSFLPGAIGDFVHEANRVLRFIVKGEKDFFPGVSASIDELAPLKFTETGRLVAGSAAGLIVALAGAAWMAVKRPAIALFACLPPLTLGLMSVQGMRFVIFLSPVYALGLGYLFGAAIPSLTALRTLKPRAARLLLPAICVAIILAPGGYECFARRLSASFTSQDVSLGLMLRDAPGEKAAIWNWWDAGYFFQYWAGKRTFIDGGNQIPMRNYISFAPLASEDPELARNWIRYFTVTDINGMNLLEERLGGFDKSLAFLKEIFANPDQRDEILKAYGLPVTDHWRNFFFPPADVYTVLTPAFITKAWWYAYGSWKPGRELVEPPLTVVADKRATRLDRGRGQLVKRDKAVAIQRVVQVRADGLPRVSEPVRDQGYVVVDFLPQPDYLLVEPELYDSLVFRLLFLGPQDTPGFSAYRYHPLVGGIWKVS